MMKYIKIFKLSFRVELMASMVYRLNFVLTLLQNGINAMAGILTIGFVFDYFVRIGSCEKHEALIITATALILNSIYRGVLAPNLRILTSSIRNGNFDFVLLRPVSVFYTLTLGRFDFASLLSAVFPIAYIVYVIADYNLTVTAVNVLGYMLFLVIGLVILTALMMIVFSLSFIFVNITRLEELYYTFMSIFEKPKTIYNKYLGFILFYFIPLIPITNIPSQILIGTSNTTMNVAAVLISIIFSLLAAAFIRYGIKRYESASS